MGLKDKIFSNREFLDLKNTNQETAREIRHFKHIENKDEKLAKFKTLLANLDEFFKEEPIVARAGESLSEKDGIANKLTPSSVAAGYITFLGTIFTIAGGGFMAAAMPFIAAPCGALALGLMVTGHKLRYHVRAKELGVRPSDVKHAIKLQRMHRHVQHIVNHLDPNDSTLLRVKKLRSTFTAGTEKARKEKKRGRHRKPGFLKRAFGGPSVSAPQPPPQIKWY